MGLLIAFLLVGAGVVPAYAAEPGSVSGRFTRTTGAAIPSAQVDLTDRYGNTRASTVTDADGRYRFAPVEPGEYKLRYRWPEWAEQWWPGRSHDYSADLFTVVEGRETVIDETAVPVGEAELLVVDAATGAPMPGVCVSGGGPQFIRGCADAEGSVRLGPARTGYYNVTAEPPAGYLYGGVEIDIRAEERVTATISMLREAVLEVSFVDAATGAPVLDACVAEVWASSRGVVDQYLNNCSHGTGMVRLGMRFEGRTRLFVRPSDGVHGSQWVGRDGGTGDLEQAEWFTLSHGATTSVTVELDAAGGITGTVTDAATGAPVSGVCVTVTPAGPWRPNPYEPNCTHTEGRYTLAGLGPYDWKVQFPDPSGAYAWQWSGDKADRFGARPVRVRPGTTVTVDARLRPAGSVTGTIVGMNRPPQYVSVNAVNARTGDWAAPDGRVTSAGVYTLSGLDTQAIRISFVATTAAHDPVWHPHPVWVVAGRTRNLDLHVPAS